MSAPTADADRTARVRAAAIDLLDRAAGPLGFGAAVGDAHYEAVWCRDAAITCLGVLTTGDDRWRAPVARTLATLARHASPLGQLPNTVWPDGWWDFGEHAAVDPTLWWSWAALEARAAGWADVEVEDALPAALRWLRNRDAGGTGLVQSPGGSDWMDSSVRRSGTTLHANALWCRVVELAQQQHVPTGPGPTADDLRHHLDVLLWPRADTDPADALGFLPSDVRARGLPHPAAVAAHRAGVVDGRDHWASHRTWGHLVDVVDVLGNAVAVLAGVGTDEQRRAVVDGLAVRGVARPHPSRTLDTFVVAGGPDAMFDAVADANQDPRWRNPPFAYHNAASWPMVGGFHALAVRSLGDHDAADALADAVAAACLEDPDDPASEVTFPEWRHGATGAAGGARMQVWSAAAVLLAAAGAR